MFPAVTLVPFLPLNLMLSLILRLLNQANLIFRRLQPDQLFDKANIDIHTLRTTLSTHDRLVLAVPIMMRLFVQVLAPFCPVRRPLGACRRTPLPQPVAQRFLQPQIA